MDLPALTSKAAGRFDTPRYAQQSPFMKGGSRCREKSPRQQPAAGVLMRQGQSPGKASAHQPCTCTVTVLTLWALGAVTVSSPSRYTAWSCSRSIGWGKRKLRLQVP
jgi:hypothetical protein